jgi:hypothetical protein
MVVSLVVLAFACIIIFSSDLVQTVLGDRATGIVNPGDSAGVAPEEAGGAADGAGTASFRASEQAGLSWPLLMLLLLIPLTGAVIYYYGFVKCH